MHNIFYCINHKPSYCMRTFFYCLFAFTIIASKSYAQLQPEKNLSEKDSIELENQLKNLLAADAKPVSYFYASLGLGNRLYNPNNKSLNATHGKSSVAVYSPSISYFNKTGFGISASANVHRDNDDFGFNQYSLSPSFDLIGNENISFGISFTRYFVKNKYSEFSSTVLNDFYSSVGYKNSWLKPSFALGFSSGAYGEAKNKDTLIGGVKRYIYDTLNYKTNSFYTIFSVGHDFLWNSVLDKTDGISFSPSLMLNAGSGSYTVSRTTNVYSIGGDDIFRAQSKKRRQPRTQTSKFNIQSIGLNLNLNYSIGNLSIEPQYYLDYYVGSNVTDLTTSIFMLRLGYTF